MWGGHLVKLVEVALVFNGVVPGSEQMNFGADVQFEWIQIVDGLQPIDQTRKARSDLILQLSRRFVLQQ